MYMYIFHYLNYHLPDFVTAICLHFIFGFSFLDICFTLLKAITNHLWNLHSSPEIKPSAFGVGTLTPRPQNTRELTLEVSNIENSHKGNHLNTRPCITQPPVAPMQDASFELQTKQKYKPNHQQMGVQSHSALPIRKNKKTNKNSAQISPYMKLTQAPGPILGGKKPKERKNSIFFKERIQLSLKLGKRRPQTQ